MSAPTIPLSIGGAARAAKRSFEQLNPVTGELASRAAAATIDDGAFRGRITEKLGRDARLRKRGPTAKGLRALSP